jgi:hypothetical protein
MSLDVPTELLGRAERGDVPDEEFIACVRDSLPYAWAVVRTVAEDLRDGGRAHAEHAVPPPSETHRGQLLRALASDAIRAGLERHFQVRLGFQNCHRVAAFAPTDAGREAHRAFATPRAQLLNQSPELRDC